MAPLTSALSLMLSHLLSCTLLHLPLTLALSLVLLHTLLLPLTLVSLWPFLWSYPEIFLFKLFRESDGWKDPQDPVGSQKAVQVLL